MTFRITQLFSIVFISCRCNVHVVRHHQVAKEKNKELFHNFFVEVSFDLDIMACVYKPYQWSSNFKRQRLRSGQAKYGIPERY
jgi:hypothetical protein